jgi:CDP-6-deoxy-D-xylo-4-hexulose-3-dehydrase
VLLCVIKIYYLLGEKMDKSSLLREKILNLTREYYKETFILDSYKHGDRIPFSGRVFDSEELSNLVGSSLDFWLTSGRFSKEFEERFSEFINSKYCLLVNSGSSANLVAFSTLTSPLLGDRRINPGDEVITVAAGFPTTVAPIIQNGCIPVFIDIELGTYNIDVNQLETALSAKTKAIMIAHTLGNPFDVEAVIKFANKHHLWVIEDCCDALGSEVNGKKVGTFGHLATVSFYPAHHMTMGEGGAVITNMSKLFVIARSFRDWGRDCYCEPGKDNTCGRRFSGQHGNLPYGYDHKYVYSHIGYNLKVTDMQASVGLAQLEKLTLFIQRRKDNFKKLNEHLSQFEEYLLLPRVLENHDPSWFGYPITVRDSSPFTRDEFTFYLESKAIQTRLVFAGNLTKQPAFINVRYRVAGNLKNTDKVMNDTFFIGVYPGIDDDRLRYMLSSISKFINLKVGTV